MELLKEKCVIIPVTSLVITLFVAYELKYIPLFFLFFLFLCNILLLLQVIRKKESREKLMLKELDTIQSKLQENEERLLSALSFMKEFVFVLNEDGIFQEYYKPSEDAALYLEPEIFLQKHYSTVLPYDVVAMVGKAFEEVREKGDSVFFEYSLNMENSVEWFRARASARKGSRGEFAGLTVVVRNISDSKNGEGIQKEAERALKKEQERLEAIIEGTNVGTWEWNIQTGETLFNERWASIVGYTLEELAPTSIETWMDLAHPDDLKESEALINKHFSGELDYYEYESRMKHKDGHWIWVFDRGKVNSWSDDGKPLLMSGTHQEITERKEAETKVREAEEQLRITLAETERANQLMVGREERIIEMKEEVNRLLLELGREEKYRLLPEESGDV